MTEIRVPVEMQMMVLADADWAPMPGELGFSLGDPIASTLFIGPVGDPNAIPWVFAFDLLYRVSTGWTHVGAGDVRFSADALHPEWVILRLSSPGGTATLRLKVLDIKKFVQAVKGLPVPDSDIVAQSVDAAINAILEGSE